jgi:preflagellin peptidase FlaK
LVGGFLIAAIIIDVIHYGVLAQEYTVLFAENSASLIALGMILYFSHILAGGDCKLLIVIALMVPAELYWNVSDETFTLWYALCLMFLCGFVYLLVETVILFLKDNQRDRFKQVGMDLGRSILNYGMTIVYIAALSHIYLLFVQPYFSLPGMVYTLICILAIWGLNAVEVFRSKVLLVAVLIFDILMTIFTGNITINTFWLSYVVVLLFIMIRIFINKYNYQNIPTESVRKGMILSQATTILFQQSRVKGLPRVSDESLKSRLSEEEAEAVRRWESSKYGQPSVNIVRKMPFGVFMFSGLLLYLVIRGVAS